MMTCRFCREHLPGYIARELTPAARSQVAAHIQTCNACYAAYVQQREVSGELARTLPALGGALPRLDRVWTGIQADMQQPKRAPIRHNQAGYTLIALLLMITLLVHSSLNARHFSLPTPPTPAALNTPSTPVAAVLVTYTVRFTPPVQPNHAPVMGSTDTP